MTALPTAPAPAYAPQVDAARWGEHRRSPTGRPRHGGPVVLVPGRHHVYAARPDATSHRIDVLRRLAGLERALTLSYVDGLRDGRGWAFRESTGPDPVNGFTLLREAYTAGEPNYDGVVAVPLLWDRAAGRIASDDGEAIADAVLATDDRLRPAALAGAVDALAGRVGRDVAARLGTAVYRPAEADALRRALASLDRHLEQRTWLVGRQLTDADVRLWVQVVRYDAGPNAHGAVGPRLDAFRYLWAWARRVWALDEVRAATDLARLGAPYADLPPWD